MSFGEVGSSAHFMRAMPSVTSLDGAGEAQPQVPLHAEFAPGTVTTSAFFQQEVGELHRIGAVRREVGRQ